jgi:hypothetical protein
MAAFAIRTFVQGKIRRSELGDRLRVETPAVDDPDLGPLEARLVSSSGSLDFHRAGLLLDGGVKVSYSAIQRVAAPRTTGPEGKIVDIETQNGIHRLNASPAGADVTYATLRWIGNALLRRKIAE